MYLSLSLNLQSHACARESRQRNLIRPDIHYDWYVWCMLLVSINPIAIRASPTRRYSSKISLVWIIAELSEQPSSHIRERYCAERIFHYPSRRRHRERSGSIAIAYLNGNFIRYTTRGICEGDIGSFFRYRFGRRHERGGCGNRISRYEE